MGRLVQIGSVEGYLGRPSGQGPWPTVIVIQEWWGLDNQTESIVDRFAGLHYLAFAPDLFDPGHRLLYQVHGLHRECIDPFWPGRPGPCQPVLRNPAATPLMEM